LGPEETRFLTDSTNRRQIQELSTHFLAEALSRGVADAGAIRGEVSPTIALRRGETERIIPRDSILTFADLMEQAEAAGLNLPTAVGQRTLRRLVGAFYQPTIVLDPLVTVARRSQLRGSVNPIKYSVRTGERIVRAGEPITEEAHAKLLTLLEEHRRRGSGGLAVRSAAGALLFNALVLSGFWLLIAFYRRESYAHLREMIFLGALFALVVLLTAALSSFFPGRPAVAAFIRTSNRSSIGSTRYFSASLRKRACISLSFAGSLAAKSFVRLKSVRVSYNCQMSSFNGRRGNDSQAARWMVPANHPS
jgi:hypothetical protein